MYGVAGSVAKARCPNTKVPQLQKWNRFLYAVLVSESVSAQLNVEQMCTFAAIEQSQKENWMSQLLRWYLTFRFIALTSFTYSFSFFFNLFPSHSVFFSSLPSLLFNMTDLFFHFHHCLKKPFFFFSILFLTAVWNLYQPTLMEMSLKTLSQGFSPVLSWWNVTRHE